MQSTSETNPIRTAKVVRLHRVGGPEVLEIEDLPLEAPKAGEIRLRVQAIGLNRAEMLFRAGNYLEQPEFPSRIGVEAAGLVDAVGPDVTNVRVGESVSVAPGQSIGRYGTYGESAIVPAVSALHYPANLTPLQAASIWVQYLTSYFAFVDVGDLRPGQSVLVTAATGGAGLGAIQVARLLGATIIATTRSSAKRQSLLDAGAHHVIVTALGSHSTVQTQRRYCAEFDGSAASTSATATSALPGKKKEFTAAPSTACLQLGREVTIGRAARRIKGTEAVTSISAESSPSTFRLLARAQPAAALFHAPSIAATAGGDVFTSLAGNKANSTITAYSRLCGWIRNPGPTAAATTATARSSRSSTTAVRVQVVYGLTLGAAEINQPADRHRILGKKSDRSRIGIAQTNERDSRRQIDGIEGKHGDLVAIGTVGGSRIVEDTGGYHTGALLDGWGGVIEARVNFVGATHKWGRA